MPAGGPGVGGNFMEERFDREKLIQKIAALAFSDPTDAVRLAFLPEGSDRTFAEMESAEKNAISHRARATKKLIDYLKKTL